MYRFQRHISVLRALSDETRLKIIYMLAGNSMYANQLLECLNITQPTLSYHMKVLIEADLVQCKRQTTHIFYNTNPITLNLMQELCTTLKEGH